MMEISESGKKEALALARWTLEWHLRNNHQPKPQLTDPIFKETRGLFVTLHLRGDLKGCLGLIEPVLKVEEGIPEMTLGSATRDPRFDPVLPEEMDDLNIEISLLTPLEEISDPSDIEVGTHGLVVERGFYRGLLLPQVAVEEQWDVGTFLEHTCLKAGLPPEAWKESDSTIYRFSAQVFSE